MELWTCSRTDASALRSNAIDLARSRRGRRLRQGTDWLHALQSRKYTVTVPLESYLDFTGADTSFNLDDFWCSTLSEQDAEIREFLERRVHPVGVGDYGLQWDDVLLPSQKKAQARLRPGVTEESAFGSMFARRACDL